MRSDPDGTIRQHALLIVNPAAGGGRSARAARKLEAALQRVAFPYERTDTTGPGHARTLAAASTGLVIVAGGDGTVNEVVDGLPVRGDKLGPLAVLPCGSGDDFAGGAGFGADPVALAARLRAPAWPVDVGIAEFAGSGATVRRRFANCAALGLDAEVAARAKERRFLRGRLLYTMATLAVLRHPPRFQATLTLDAGNGQAPFTETGELAFVSTCNGPRVGGGLLLAPEARVDDGRFHVVRVSGAGGSRLLWLLAKLLVGRHRRDARVRTFVSARVHIVTAVPIAAALDGEPLPGRVHAATFTIAPERLLLLGAAPSRSGAPPAGP